MNLRKISRQPIAWLFVTLMMLTILIAAAAPKSLSISVLAFTTLLPLLVAMSLLSWEKEKREDATIAPPAPPPKAGRYFCRPITINHETGCGWKGDNPGICNQTHDPVCLKCGAYWPLRYMRGGQDIYKVYLCRNRCERAEPSHDRRGIMRCSVCDEESLYRYNVDPEVDAAMTDPY